MKQLFNCQQALNAYTCLIASQVKHMNSFWTVIYVSQRRLYRLMQLIYLTDKLHHQSVLHKYT